MEKRQQKIIRAIVVTAAAVIVLLMVTRGPAAWIGDQQLARDPNRPRWDRIELSHCGWDFRTIRYKEEEYVKDVHHRVDGELDATYSPHTRLPAAARYTGYHSGDLLLWVGPSGNSIYVVSPGRVQRWPRFTLGCA